MRKNGYFVLKKVEWKEYQLKFMLDFFSFYGTALIVKKPDQIITLWKNNNAYYLFYHSVIGHGPITRLLQLLGIIIYNIIGSVLQTYYFIRKNP